MRKREKTKREKYTVLPSETLLLTDVSYSFSTCLSLCFYTCHIHQTDRSRGVKTDTRRSSEITQEECFSL